MTNSAATFMAVIFGLAVFAVIVVIGWRSVQSRRIVRMRDADGHETIIVADEDDEFTSVETTTTGTAPSAPEAALSLAEETRGGVTSPAPEFGRKGETAI